ncbi:MAG TPA: prenyltransferase/squalene oxidase repeat-containing protein [Verrucomicrobiales bacterium]|nr:prenyltransferase/squalene oxidase repeat-containing protein [Verrucomicrobiales bacterium]
MIALRTSQGPGRFAWASLLASLIFAVPAAGQGLLERRQDPIPTLVENVYRRGLDYLAQTQSDQGCWPDNYGEQPGVVGLAIVALLSHGEDPNTGPFAKVVHKALDYLIKQQNQSNGYIGSSMYNHGFATLALAESYGNVDDDRLGPVLKKAIDLILSSQQRNPRGAWRYSPESQDADTTVAGSQMVALFAARNAGIAVPEEAIEKGLKFYESCYTPGGGYGYSSAGGPNVPRTAIGVLVYALARKKDAKGFEESFRFITQDLDYRDSSYPFYCEYYMAQALFQTDPEVWREWDARNVKYLASIQQPDGSWQGNHGPAFSTSAALLSMALNYRFLPIYER